jgi:hypothetical protein
MDGRLSNMLKTTKEVLYYLYENDPNIPSTFIVGSNGFEKTISHFNSIDEARRLNSDTRDKLKYKTAKVEITTTRQEKILKFDLDKPSKKERDELIEKKKIEDEIHKLITEYGDKIGSSCHSIEEYMSKMMSYEFNLRFSQRVFREINKKSKN